jgi:hypothetical protein
METEGNVTSVQGQRKWGKRRDPVRGPVWERVMVVMVKGIMRCGPRRIILKQESKNV